MLWTVLVVNGWTAGWDRALMAQAGALRSASPWLADPAWFVTRAGDGASRIVIALLVAAGLWRARAAGKALWLALTVGGALLLSTILKALIDRPRPDMLVHLDEIGNASYPSGHALGAIVLGLAVGLLIRNGPIRILLAVYVLLVSASRVVLGVHWPSDIVGGLLIGACWTMLACLIGRRFRIV